MPTLTSAELVEAASPEKGWEPSPLDKVFFDAGTIPLPSAFLLVDADNKPRYVVLRADQCEGLVAKTVANGDAAESTTSEQSHAT